MQKSTSITLKPSKAKLLTYTKEAIGVMGSTEVTVEHNQQSATIPLIVTKGAGPCLLGRNWLAALKLDWQKILLCQVGAYVANSPRQVAIWISSKTTWEQ